MLERTHPSSNLARAIVLTRGRAAVVVVMGYAAAALCIKPFLGYLETVHGYDDARDDQMALVFGVIAAVLCLKSLLAIYRRPTLDI